LELVYFEILNQFISSSFKIRYFNQISLSLFDILVFDLI